MEFPGAGLGASNGLLSADRAAATTKAPAVASATDFIRSPFERPLVTAADRECRDIPLPFRQIDKQVRQFHRWWYVSSGRVEACRCSGNCPPSVSWRSCLLKLPC